MTFLFRGERPPAPSPRSLPSGGAGAGAARPGKLEGEAGGRSGQHLSALFCGLSLLPLHTLAAGQLGMFFLELSKAA